LHRIGEINNGFFIYKLVCNFGSSKSGNSPSIYSYKSAGDNKAAILTGSGYWQFGRVILLPAIGFTPTVAMFGQTLVATKTGAVITTAVI
jgi:hypothetical protein